MTLLATALLLVGLGYLVGVAVERRRRVRQVQAIRDARKSASEYLKQTAGQYLRGSKLR